MKTNLVQYLEDIVILNPDNVAVSDGEEQVTFRELYQRICILAEAFTDILEGKKNQPIALYMKKGISSYLVIWSILFSGNFYSPLDVNSPKTRIKKILRTLKPVLIVCDDSLEKIEGFDETKLFRLTDEIFNRSVGMSSKKVYTDVIDMDPAYVLFTSGSTGEPKGVVVPHRAVIDFIEWSVSEYELNETDVFANQAPFYFDASMPDLFLPICIGAKLLILPENAFVFPMNIMEMLNKWKVTTIFWVPSALITMTQHPVFCGFQIPYLKRVIFCGEIMPIKYLNMWMKSCPQAMYINMYGPTEAAYACTYYRVNRQFQEDEILPIGMACGNTELILIDEQGEVVRDGEQGELCIRGAGLALGYYGDEKKTKSVFVQNPLVSAYKDIIYKTGDIVRYNEYGELFYLGRKDFQIKHRGYRIELGEIEAAAYQISIIKMCCAKYNKERNEIELFCTVEKGKEIKDVYKELKLILPQYMLPNYIRILEEMPLNANGKIDRQNLYREE